MCTYFLSEYRNYRKNSNVSRDDALMYGAGILIMTILPGIASSHSLFKVFCNGAKGMQNKNLLQFFIPINCEHLNLLLKFEWLFAV